MKLLFFTFCIINFREFFSQFIVLPQKEFTEVKAIFDLSQTIFNDKVGLFQSAFPCKIFVNKIITLKANQI